MLHETTRRSGFTLLEVMVALMLSGIVVVGVRNIFATTSDSATIIARRAETLDRTANGIRFLRHVIENIESTGEAATDFGGDSAGVTFTTWCTTPDGWLDRCRASLVLDNADGDSRQVVVRLSTGETLATMTTSARAQLRYLTDPAVGDFWTDRWPAGVFLPRAIGIMTDDDTVVLRTGDRE